MKNRIDRRYAKKVKIPISIVLDTIFNEDNKDVELLTRQAKKYGYVDLVEKDGQNFYQLQDDYDRQSFYTELDFDELKQYAYEDFLLSQIAFRDEKIERLEEQLNDEIQDELKQSEIMVMKQQEIERLHSIIKEVREILNQDKASASFNTAERNALEILDKVGGNNNVKD